MTMRPVATRSLYPVIPFPSFRARPFPQACDAFARRYSSRTGCQGGSDHLVFSASWTQADRCGLVITARGSSDRARVELDALVVLSTDAP
jgi:hypothetical protein